MNKPESGVARVFYYMWYSLDLSRRIILNFLFMLLLLFIVIAIFSGDDDVLVPEGAALVLAPNGIITEEPAWVDPVSEAVGGALNNQEAKEESIHDIIEILRNAKDDDRITSLVIYPQSVLGIGPAMMEMFRDAVADFKESGKKVFAMADFLSQSQYYLAAQADEVYLHPHGAVIIEGYSRVRTYHKSLLDNIKVTPNVFKVGKYKTAIEPYLRDSMSDYAKEANLAYLNDLWTDYKKDIVAARGLDSDQFEQMINQFDQKMQQAGGDWGTIAVENQLVDGLKSRPDFREMMVELVGENKKKTSYKQIHHKDYLKVIKPPIQFVNPNTQKVALIVAKGAILDGNQKEGSVGGTTLAAKIRKARKNEKTAAIVLRVDSPGGSAFASEIIREEIVKAKEQGIKFVVSMGTYAASGGYWISANADEIWARPTTITGSIGIYGLIPTFEKSLEWAGVYRDGVGTTELAGAFDPGRGLTQPVKNIIQANIENGYQRFLNLVANGRGMTVDAVDQIAQGRVWSGKKALELGLVDKLGSLKDAIQSAAALAELEEGKYDTWTIKRELSKNEQLIKQILESEAAAELSDDLTLPSVTTPTAEFLLDLQNELKQLQNFNDPQHSYVHCNCVID